MPIRNPSLGYLLKFYPQLLNRFQVQPAWWHPSHHTQTTIPPSFTLDKSLGVRPVSHKTIPSLVFCFFYAPPPLPVSFFFYIFFTFLFFLLITTLPGLFRNTAWSYPPWFCLNLGFYFFYFAFAHLYEDVLCGFGGWEMDFFFFCLWNVMSIRLWYLSSCMWYRQMKVSK